MPPISRRSPQGYAFDPRYDEEPSLAPSSSIILIEDPRQDRRSRPTLSDIDVLPRRRLRDGSASTSTSASRSSGGTHRVSADGHRNVQTRFGALKEQSLQRARNGGSLEANSKPQTGASSPERKPSVRPTKRRRQSVISISSDDGIEIIEPVRPPKNGRWTAKEKGKGRAIDMTQMPVPIAKIDPVGIAKKTMEGFKDNEDMALGQYSCPICLSRPSQPVMTPCGHLMCGACLHLTLLTSIIKELPGAGVGTSSNSVEETRRRRREIRNGIATAQLSGHPRFHQNPNALKEVKRLQWVGSRPPRDTNETALRMLEEPKAWDDFDLLKPGLGERGGWLLDGPCPVCRKELKGGLGPRGYGTVIHLEPRKIST